MDGHTEAAAPLLDVQDLTVKFVSRAATVTAVNGATFSLRAGEVREDLFLKPLTNVGQTD